MKACLSSVALLASLAANAAPMSLTVDATDSPRKLFHAALSLPVRPGPLTLVYPRWAIPTYELPAAMLNDIVRLTMSARGARLEWRRDPADLFAFHLVVPEGADALEVSMDVVVPASRSDLNAATAYLFMLDWNTLILYPQGAAADELRVRARLRLPEGWKSASALASTGRDPVEFEEASLSTLVDSPVLAGRYFDEVRLAPHVTLDVAADRPQGTRIPPQWREWLGRLIAEADALFGAEPFESYRFLVAVSDEVGNDGVEHLSSSDLRLALNGFSEASNRLAYGYLIPHELVHAWNGKLRIPAGLVRRNFQEPQTTELLWVYEGLTRYLNWVLAARSGMFSQEEARDYAAYLAAKTAHRPGREWRTLADTALSARILNDAPDEWESTRRATDYYDEALFIWLEADGIIRRQSHRSLDDFCARFFRPPGGSYSFDDVVAALEATAPYDWKRFLTERLEAHDRAPLDGLTASGWDLEYGEAPGAVQAARDRVNKTVEARFSLGLLAQESGAIVDVLRDSPAWRAGLGPGMKIVRVGAQHWSPAALRAAIAARRDVKLAVQNGAATLRVAVANPRGPRNPRLVRNGNADTLADVLRPRHTPK